ncbi:KH domain-containing, RNA-binding, signal transduction-associated protein 2-like [Cylas formicarius]|uniref:KH domain-containing, RNA-binding, signal transduction-associated protein 2-like n=1 Tax=Cylas formicarius TaxID=197179 RepID=UPI002958D82D|nr:KH domain-containing, RNA-binding, signal transduction-associated protein 2-like [Cylas formicarius]
MDLDCDSVETIGLKSGQEHDMNREQVTASGVNHNNYKSRNGKGAESRRMVDITRDKPIKVAVRVVVPVRDHPKFNFVGKLLGPKGNSLKRLQEDTMCKMAVLGRGSMRDRHKEEELRASGDPKFQHLSEELHVEISAFATPAEAHARIAYALAEVRRFLVPDYNDDIRQEQMWEMQVLSNQRNNGGGKGGEENGGGNFKTTPETATGEDRLKTPTESGLQSPRDAEHPALRGIQPETSTNSSETTQPLSGDQVTPSNGLNSSGSILGGGRKRPLLAGCAKSAMTPTKRTVMGLLAKARAAQAKGLAIPFPGVAPECPPTLIPLLREDFVAGTVNLNLI